LGRRLADKLVKVWCNDGRETWLLVHIEVQGKVDPEFAQRMYTYHYRIFDRYAREVVSLAVLGDTTPSWRPTQFAYAHWGCELSLKFPVVKLLDYRQSWAILEDSRNPFAVVIMAHLQTQATAGAMERRASVKWALLRRLYERGYARQEVLNLFRFIDWLLALPVELEQALQQEINDYEEARHMTYITSWERFGIEKGIQQGIQQGRITRSRDAVLEVLETRFAAAPVSLTRRINQIADERALKWLHRQAILVASLKEFAQCLEDALADAPLPDGEA